MSVCPLELLSVRLHSHMCVQSDLELTSLCVSYYVRVPMCVTEHAATVEHVFECDALSPGQQVSLVCISRYPVQVLSLSSSSDAKLAGL